MAFGLIASAASTIRRICAGKYLCGCETSVALLLFDNESSRNTAC